MNKFIDPVDVPDAKGNLPDVHRTSAIYPLSVHAFLHGCRGRTGTTQTTANILLKKLQDELTRNGITSYDPDAYELAVAGCTIVLGGCSVAVPSAGSQPAGTGKAVNRNDRRRTRGMGRSSTGALD